MTADLWARYQRYLCRVPALGLTLDVSRMNFGAAFLDRMRPALDAAFDAIHDLQPGMTMPGNLR